MDLIIKIGTAIFSKLGSIIAYLQWISPYLPYIIIVLIFIILILTYILLKNKSFKPGIKIVSWKSVNIEWNSNSVKYK
jgi:hypothetical protein